MSNVAKMDQLVQTTLDAWQPVVQGIADGTIVTTHGWVRQLVELADGRPIQLSFGLPDA